MIRQYNHSKAGMIYAVINDAAQAYHGVIPPDCWKEPYMSKDELRHEMDAGVVFWGHEEDGKLLGVMGIQHVQDVTLIRHAYVRTGQQNRGIGGQLLSCLEAKQLARSWLAPGRMRFGRFASMKSTVFDWFPRKKKIGC